MARRGRTLGALPAPETGSVASQSIAHWSNCGVSTAGAVRDVVDEAGVLLCDASGKAAQSRWRIRQPGQLAARERREQNHPVDEFRRAPGYQAGDHGSPRMRQQRHPPTAADGRNMLQHALELTGSLGALPSGGTLAGSPSWPRYRSERPKLAKSNAQTSRPASARSAPEDRPSNG